MKRIVALIVVLLYGYAGFAQFSDSTHYLVKYASTGSINRTNDGNSYLLNNNLGFKVSKKRVTLNAGASYVYGKNNASLTNNDVSAAVDFNLYTDTAQIYYWGLANYDKSYSLKINNRFQGGAGIGYDLIRRPNALLNITDGLLFENSNLFLHDTIQDVYSTVRNSFRVQYKWTIHNIVVLEGNNYFQNSLIHGDDYMIRCINSMSVKLRSWLSLTASMTYNKLNRTDRENLLFNYGVTFEKYF
ncbi:Protein of unknown function, DUF481 [Chitinophaga eiseniae]|uniref:DUF481 domain-containing protein n=1 Tax=Chitinophaga eiseniae TaxID=634771 RepID=A0A1T4TVW3_9BACT|nr:DUF481 domain-containing protein [Chitinophaga eiseniae]SKA44595.1 Protein of unknown function, DUF481 [Chitinophaga eiseniae]